MGGPAKTWGWSRKNVVGWMTFGIRNVARAQPLRAGRLDNRNMDFGRANTA